MDRAIKSCQLLTVGLSPPSFPEPILELPCGHNDCARPWTLIKNFLEEKGVLAPRSADH